MMTGDPQHIRVEFNLGTRNVANIVRYFALDQQTLLNAQLWQAQQKTPPSAVQLADWLSENGGLLDRADGPAYIATHADGSRYEAWYSQGRFVKEAKTLPGLSAIPGVTLYPPGPS